MSAGAPQVGQMPQQTDARMIFQDRFRSLAWDQLAQRLPALLEHVINFKADVHLDEVNGLGVGFFDAAIGPFSVQIPAILDGDRVQPIDVMFLPEKNLWLPLVMEWVDFLLSVTPDALGYATPAPKNLATDVDIRSIVRPPVTGRTVYASDRSDPPLFRYLRSAGDSARTTLISRMRANPKVAKVILDRYGVDRVRDACAPRALKTASSTDSSPDVIFLDASTADFTKVATDYGPRAAIVMSQLTQKGYAVEDRRRLTKTAVLAEHLTRLVTPSTAGVYTIYFKDGKSRLAICVPAPVKLWRDVPIWGPAARQEPDSESPCPCCGPVVRRTLIYTEDGACGVVAHGFLAKQHMSIEPRVARWLESVLGETRPASKGVGFFARCVDGRLDATEVVRLHNVTSTAEGTIAEIHYYQKGALTPDTEDLGWAMPRRATLRQGALSNNRTIHVTAVQGLSGDICDAYVPRSYGWVPVTRTIDEQDLVRERPQLIRYMSAFPFLSESVAMPVKVAYTRSGWRVDGVDQPGKVAALKTLVLGRGLSLKSAEHLVRLAEATPAEIEAAAMDPAAMAQAEAAGAMPPQQPVFDPATGTPIDPTTGMPMGPPDMMQPGGDPLLLMDSAAQEVMSLLTLQSQEIDRQMMAARDRLNAQLEAVQMLLSRQMAALQGEQNMDPVTLNQLAQQMALSAISTAQGPPAPAGMGAMDPGAGMGGQPAAAPPQPMSPEAVTDVAEMPPEAQESTMDASILGSMATSEELDTLGTDYLPEFRDALSGMARLLVDMRIKAPELRVQQGERAFQEQMERTRRVLTNMGPLVLDLQRNASVFRGANLLRPSGSEMPT